MLRWLLTYGWLFLGAGVSVQAADVLTQSVTTETSALAAYETGFAYTVMRAPDGRGVRLNDMVAIEDDGPGSGWSQKGTCVEPLYRGVLAKKTFWVERPFAHEAYVVLFLDPPQETEFNKPFYYLLVNGRRIEGPPAPAHERVWQAVSIPPSLLKKGLNEIIVGCDAEQDKGCTLHLAREDEYDAGGAKYTYQGNTAMICADQVEIDPAHSEFRPIQVGEHSSKSRDGGKTWVKGKIGETDDVVGEYTIRLCLKQYHPTGRLRSSAIDLWDGLPGFDKIKPICQVENLKIEVTGETFPDTQIVWSVRFADTADMNSVQWGDFAEVGAGSKGIFTLDNKGKRYLQWEAELKTADPLQSPVVKKVSVARELSYSPPPDKAFYVWQYENVEHVYRSFKFSYENPAHPKLELLRQRLKTDELLADAHGDFEKVNRLRHYISTLWKHGNPAAPTYPEWDALQILDNKDQRGCGGMCVQFSHVLAQGLIALGYHAHHTMFGHEVTEVYVDELGKWVHVDAWSSTDAYEYNTETGMPLNVLEQHQYYLKGMGFSAQRPIDWLSPQVQGPAGGQFAPQPVSYSGLIPIADASKAGVHYHKNVAFLRFAPRNDYFSRPFPRPLTEGMSHWPWTGYINWYDEATPRKLQYALHSDRTADLYPTMNRVQFSAVYGLEEGDILIDMFTFAPYFAGFEINVDRAGWQPSPARFVWKLRPSALNTLQMRVKNKLGPTGKESGLQVIWHHKAPSQTRTP